MEGRGLSGGCPLPGWQDGFPGALEGQGLLRWALKSARLLLRDSATLTEQL